LLAIDHAQSLFSLSAYTDPLYERLHPYHLVIPRMLLDFTAGQLNFVRTCPDSVRSLEQMN
jgi:hypothetical protein